MDEQTKHTAIGSRGRTWHILEREVSNSVVLYYTKDEDPAHYVVWDSLDRDADREAWDALRADNARLAAERDALRDIVNRAYAAHQSDALCKCLQCKILRLSPSIVDLDAAALTADAGGDG
jgi:hypothetical protein